MTLAIWNSTAFPACLIARFPCCSYFAVAQAAELVIWALTLLRTAHAIRRKNMVVNTFYAAYLPRAPNSTAKWFLTLLLILRSVKIYASAETGNDLFQALLVCSFLAGPAATRTCLAVASICQMWHALWPADYTSCHACEMFVHFLTVSVCIPLDKHCGSKAGCVSLSLSVALMQVWILRLSGPSAADLLALHVAKPLFPPSAVDVKQAIMKFDTLVALHLLDAPTSLVELRKLLDKHPERADKDRFSFHPFHFLFADVALARFLCFGRVSFFLALLTVTRANGGNWHQLFRLPVD